MHIRRSPGKRTFLSIDRDVFFIMGSLLEDGLSIPDSLRLSRKI
jgi:hypothetical protein